jgi:RNA polymerase sigma factor (sigma-70 family)
LAAVPSIGRASRVEGGLAPEADATQALYEQYANQVFRYCRHQLGSREEAEDAVQSTFLNAFRGIKRGVVPDLEAAWLFKIAHNVCLSRRRSAWRRGRIESPADFEVIEELAPAPSRRADELIGLQDVLERLPETQRRAILLREWQGLSYREIAEELELSQAAVETLIFRARRSLASGLEEAPKEQRNRRRAVRALDWGNVVTALKTALVGGSAAAKIAATVAVVSGATVVAAGPVQHHIRYHAPASPPPAANVRAKAPVASGHVAPTTAFSVTPVRLGRAHARAKVHHATAQRSLPAVANTQVTAPPVSEPVQATPTPTPTPEPAAPTPAPAAPVTPVATPTPDPAPVQPTPDPAPTTPPLQLAPPSEQPVREPTATQPVAPSEPPKAVPAPTPPIAVTTVPTQTTSTGTYTPGGLTASPVQPAPTGG